MRYFVLRNDSRLLRSLSKLTDIVAIVPESALLKALLMLKQATEVLDLLPDEFDELGAYLADVLVLDAGEWIDSEEPALNLLTAVTSIDPSRWMVLNEQEYSVLNGLRNKYGLRELELRSVFYGSLEYPLSLYVESHTGARYWFNDEVIARLLQTLRPREDAVSEQVELPDDVLSYPVELRKVSDGYIACVPYLGRWTFQADGSTIDEALENLQEVYHAVSQLIIQNGGKLDQPPPDPTR